MKFILYILISCLSGIFAGMGMGGGTFLIPALNLIFGISQAICQSTNIICFIVVGVICFFVYKSENLIDFKAVILISAPACIISAIFSYFSIRICSRIMKICFAVFIMLFGIIYVVTTIVSIKKTRKL